MYHCYKCHLSVPKGKRNCPHCHKRVRLGSGTYLSRHIVRGSRI